MGIARSLSAMFACLSLTLVAANDVEDDLDAPVRKAFVRETTPFVDKLLAEDAKDGSKVDRVEKPLLVYQTPPTQIMGALWAWGRSGRPKAFAEVIQADAAPAPLTVALTLTSTEMLSLKTGGNQDWKPEGKQTEPQPVADAPVPSASEDERRQQMTDLAMRLKSHEFWEPNNTRYDLTVIKSLVRRYRDEAENVQDGAVFIIANDRNPEIIVLVEAIGANLEDSRWHVSFARMGSAALHVELDGKDIWSVDRAKNIRGAPDDYYWVYNVKR